MPNVSSPAALPQYIEQLLSQHKHHSAALASIESTLARVTAALGGTPAVSAPAAPVKKKMGRPFGSGNKKAVVTVKAPVAAKPALVTKPAVKAPIVKAPIVKAPVVKVPAVKAAAVKTSPKKFTMTANEFVLAYVADKKNPTSQEVNKAWKDAGRLGLADNNLSLLTKAKKLKRTPLGKGLRGSRYTIA